MPTCPNCEADLNVETVAEIHAKSRTSFTIRPAPGEMLSLTTVGSAMVALADINKTLGQGLDITTETLLEGIEAGPDGSVTVHMLICRSARADDMPLQPS